MTNPPNRRPPGAPGLLLLLAVVCASTVLPRAASAQVVTGRVRDAASRAPVEGALVLLLDVAGRRVGGSLTDARGAFGLVAPGAGRYTLQAERIGFATVTSEPFSLTGQAGHAVDLLAQAMPVSLEGLEVEGSKRCVVRPEEGAALSRVWGEAQKALRNQAWTDESGWASFRLRRYEREYDAGMRMVLGEREVFSGWTTGNPIRSLPAEDLLAGGFIRRDDDGGYRYYGPDASVLLSDAFLDTHCFELVVDDEEPELLGLAFEPIRGRRVPDITGTLWLSRADARLRSLEFVFTSSPWPEASRVAAGHVDFDEISGGRWVVRRWWIRMPRMERDMSLMVGGRSGLRVGGILEVGGTAKQIGGVPREAPEARSVRATGTVEGVVWDSTRGLPMAGASVTATGEDVTAEADGAGRFVLRDLPAGVVELSFHHPRIDSLPMVARPTSVRVEPGSAAEVVLAVPTLSSMLDVACRGRARPEGSAVVLGHVRDARTGEPLGGATVTIEWSIYHPIAGREVQREIRGLHAGTDDRGRYTACGVPPGTRLSIRASVGEDDGPALEVTAAPEEIVVLDVDVRQRGPRS